MLCDCEYLMIARPLTYVSEGSVNMEVIFLQDYGVTNIKRVEEVDLSCRWSCRLRLREDLHKISRSEYLKS